MLNDFIHLTQGELLVKYWWLWSCIIFMAFVCGPLFRVVVQTIKKVFKNASKSMRAP